MIFNDYDEHGFRITINGCRSHRKEDEAIVFNLRFKYKDKLAEFSDVQIVNTYDQFAGTEDFGDDDVWLERYLKGDQQ